MKSDLMIGMNLFPGLAWNKPFLTLQYYHNPENYREPYHLPNFGHEHSKHCIALTYLVLIGDDKEVHFGSTEHGGQEANDFNWFDIDGIPPKEMIAYGGRETTLIPASQFLNEKYPNGA